MAYRVSQLMSGNCPVISADVRAVVAESHGFRLRRRLGAARGVKRRMERVGKWEKRIDHGRERKKRRRMRTRIKKKQKRKQKQNKQKKPTKNNYPKKHKKAEKNMEKGQRRTRGKENRVQKMKSAGKRKEQIQTTDDREK